jgi:CRP-like cAMP-binding protein
VYLQTRVSQGTLAGLVGATREHVNRALRRLVDSGVVGFAEGQLVIMDERRLQLLAAGR